MARHVSPEHIGPDGLVLDGDANNKRLVTLRMPADTYAFCMAHGGMLATVRVALAQMMEREAGVSPVALQMRNYIEIGALLVADVTALQREYAAATTTQKRASIRREWDALRARVAALTRAEPSK
jgi:hypothetical protein